MIPNGSFIPIVLRVEQCPTIIYLLINQLARIGGGEDALARMTLE